MSDADLRIDPLTGAYVVAPPWRQQRPNRPDGLCPFCPGGLEAPEPYDVRHFPNRCLRCRSRSAPGSTPRLPAAPTGGLLWPPGRRATSRSFCPLTRWSQGRSTAGRPTRPEWPGRCARRVTCPAGRTWRSTPTCPRRRAVVLGGAGVRGGARADRALPGAGVAARAGGAGPAGGERLRRGRLMSVTQIDIDEDALERVMTLSGAKTKKEAVNLALQFYAEKQERAARIARHFERALHWGALEDAERLHRAEKEIS